MSDGGIYSINYWEQFVLNKFSVKEGEEPFGVVISDQVAQDARAHPFLNDLKRRFCTHSNSQENLYMTAHGVVAVTRNVRHIGEIMPSFRLFTMHKNNLVALAMDVCLPFDKEKVISPERYFG